MRAQNNYSKAAGSHTSWLCYQLVKKRTCQNLDQLNIPCLNIIDKEIHLCFREKLGSKCTSICKMRSSALGLCMCEVLATQQRSRVSLLHGCEEPGVYFTEAPVPLLRERDPYHLESGTGLNWKRT